jgi:ankyrin repeat protein
MLALLLQHGANPNTPDQDGLTPLYWAQYLHRDALTKLLLAAGADPKQEKLALPAAGNYTFGAY